MEDDFGNDRIESKHAGKERRKKPQKRSGTDGHDGKCKYAV